MGRAAGAALKIAAPEAAVARKLVPGTPANEVHDELQRRRRAAAQKSADRRAAASNPTPPPAPEAPGGPPPAPDEGSGRPVPSLPAPVASAASTGSGVLLGVVVWAGVLAYIQGGVPAVRKLAAAKFLNKV